MKQNITLATVPHTGTHFTMELLQIAGLDRNSNPKINGTFYHLHFPYRSIDWDKMAYKRLNNDKVIMTARDPYLTGIRYINNNQLVSDIVKIWNNFFKCKDRADHFVFDIGCREEIRFDHICEVLNFLEVDYEPYADKLKEYANTWLPANARESDIKLKYLDTGELPKTQIMETRSHEHVHSTREEPIDWSAFDEAVAWYKSLPTNTQV